MFVVFRLTRMVAVSSQWTSLAMLYGSATSTYQLLRSEILSQSMILRSRMENYRWTNSDRFTL